MTRRLLIAGVIAALLGLTGCQRENTEVTVQRDQYFVDRCNEIRTIDRNLATVRDPAERARLDRARRLRVRLYNENWASFGRPEFQTTGLPSRVGTAMPTQCGGLL